MAYDSIRIDELISKLIEVEGNPHCSHRERDYYLKLIAVEAKVYDADALPQILQESHRKIILAFIREVCPAYQSQVISGVGR